MVRSFRMLSFSLNFMNQVGQGILSNFHKLVTTYSYRYLPRSIHSGIGMLAKDGNHHIIMDVVS
jgi:hypothetical protein